MPLSLSDTRAELLRVPFIAKLPEPLRERCAMMLLWCSREKDLAPRAFLYLEGKSDPNTGCVILTGQVTVEKDGEKTIYIDAPELMGEALQFTMDYQRTATVRAAVPTNAMTFSWTDIGATATQIFSADERKILLDAIRQLAWERCAELFDEAVRATQDA